MDPGGLCFTIRSASRLRRSTGRPRLSVGLLQLRLTVVVTEHDAARQGAAALSAGSELVLDWGELAETCTGRSARPGPVLVLADVLRDPAQPGDLAFELSDLRQVLARLSQADGKIAELWCGPN
jgi:hypothetical protein